jgi:RecA-family ATPase
VTDGGLIVPTPLFHSLSAAIVRLHPALLIVDSVAAVFGGNQNDRAQVRTFVSLFRRLARDAGCAVLLLDHPSLSGMTSGSGRAGSVDWSNAARARLLLRTVQAKDGGPGRELEVMKSNYGPAGEKVALRWEDGCFVPESAALASELTAASATADQIYLDCLDASIAHGRNVFPRPGRGFAPKVFAQMPEAKNLNRRALEAAQQRLFSVGSIEAVPFGPPSRGTKRIVRKGKQ